MSKGLFRAIFPPFNDSDSDAISSLRVWRTRVLNWVLHAVFALWLIATLGGISNVVAEYRDNRALYSSPLALLGSTLLLYLGTCSLIALITFNRKLQLELRAGILMFNLYVLGTVGMTLTAFSGDGRVLFLGFIVLTAVFFDLRQSLFSFFVILFTLTFIGYMQVSGLISVPVELQANAADPGAWVSGGIVFLVLSIAALISITYLLRAFEKSLDETRRALQREQRLGQMLRTVSEINQSIVRSQDREQLLKETCERLVKGREYSFAWIGLLGPDRTRLWLAASAGDVIDPEKFNTRLDQGSGPACVIQAIRTRSYFRVEPSDHGDPCPGCPRRATHPNRTAVSLPMQRDDRVLGVLVVDHTEPLSIFDDEEIALLQELADDLAYAFEKMEMNDDLQANVRFNRLLSDITHIALETADSNFLLQSAAEKMRAVYKADGCYIALWSDDQIVPMSAAASGYLEELFLEMQPTLDEINNTGFLFVEGEPLIVLDAAADPRVSSRMVEIFSFRSLLGLPLAAGGRRQGGIFLSYAEPHHFTQEEVSYGVQVAGQIALALEKARLYSEIQTRAAELERLYAAAQDMASSLLDPPALLEKLARHMTEALQVTSSNIMAVNMAEGTMQVMGEYWSEQALPQEVHSDLGRVFKNADYITIMTAMLAGEVIVMHVDDEVMTSTERDQFFEFGIKSMMFVPILAHGQLFGDIELWESRQRREFTGVEIQLAQAMAGHAASIIENSRLFAQTRQRESELEALLTVARAVSSSLQLPDVLKQAATTLARLLRVDFCSLSDYLPEQNGIVTTALYSADGDVSGIGDLGHYFSLDDYPATRQVLASGNPDINRLDDPNTDPAEIRQLVHDEMFTSLIIPLRLRGQSLGLAELFSSDPQRYFKPEEVQFASALADQVAVAIENARLYDRLEQREAHFRALIENSAEGVAILDARGMVRYLAPSEERLTGYKIEEITGGSAFTYIHPDDLPRMLEIFAEGVATPGAVRTTQYRLKRKDGEWRHFEITGHNMLDDPQIAGVIVNYRDITERKLAEQAMEESEERYRTIFQSAGVPIWEDDYSALMNAIDELKKTGVTDFESYLNENPGFVKNAAKLIKILDVNTATVGLMEAQDKAELLGTLDWILKGDPAGTFIREILALAEGKTHFEQESTLFTLKGHRRDVWISITLPQWALGYERVLVSTLDITERKQAERALQESQARLEGIIASALNAIITIDQSQRIVLFNPFAENIFGCTAEYAVGKSLDIFIPERFRKFHQVSVENFGTTNRTNRVHGQTDNLYGLRMNGEEFPLEAFVSQHQAGDEKFFTVILRDITERKHAEEELRRHTIELETLALASSALRTAQNVLEMVPILAGHALRAVNGSYAYIFLLDPETNTFVSHGWYSARSSFETRATTEPDVVMQFGEGITGRVAQTGEIYLAEDLQNDPVVLILEGERTRFQDVRSGISLPLRNENKIIGVMHILSLEKRVYKDTEIRLLTALAETASNAIHRAILFEKTLEHAVELSQAYDNTLAGWARALELRDEPTEGHTRRVTELTLQLARVMGISGDDLTNIQRGAILHDIGKMGIPDSILHKPGPFNGYEQTIMRGHPQLAYNMLSSIAFLQSALDIPYCHHEWWNGNGYPRGLKGEEIPLAARIFSVVDVWDALTSDRPYRAAWSRQQALDYIRDGAGTQFDPRIVQTFLNLIEGG